MTPDDGQSLAEEDLSSASADELRAKLLVTFRDYHSPIPVQTELVDALIAAVKRDEQARCAAIADGIAHEVEARGGETVGAEIARAIRAM